MSSSSSRPLTAIGAAQMLAGLLAAGLILLGLAPGALAHDELIDSDPAAGETLEQAPQEVTLSFSGDLTTLGAQVEVSGPLGSVVDGESQIDASQLRQPLSTDAPPGDYDVAWRVTSQDGHPISGTSDYTVEDAGTQPEPPAQDPAQESASASPEAEEPEPEGSATEGTTTDDGETDDGAGSETQDPEATDPASSDQGSATSGAPADQTGREASTDAVVIEGDDPDGAGTPSWLWVVVGVAILALLGVGTLALRRR